MTAWIVSIEEGEDEGDPAEFVPEMQDGPDLLVLANDLVSWANRTDDVHEPWPTDENFTPLTDAQVGASGSSNYLSDEINPNHSSRPSWVVRKLTFPAPPPPPPPVGDGTTIYYCCKLHPQEQGKIIIKT